MLKIVSLLFAIVIATLCLQRVEAQVGFPYKYGVEFATGSRGAGEKWTYEFTTYGANSSPCYHVPPEYNDRFFSFRKTRGVTMCCDLYDNANCKNLILMNQFIDRTTWYQFRASEAGKLTSFKCYYCPTV